MKRETFCVLGRFTLVLLAASSALGDPEAGEFNAAQWGPGARVEAASRYGGQHERLAFDGDEGTCWQPPYTGWSTLTRTFEVPLDLHRVEMKLSAVEAYSIEVAADLRFQFQPVAEIAKVSGSPVAEITKISGPQVATATFDPTPALAVKIRFKGQGWPSIHEVRLFSRTPPEEQARRRAALRASAPFVAAVTSDHWWARAGREQMAAALESLRWPWAEFASEDLPALAGRNGTAQRPFPTNRLADFDLLVLDTYYRFPKETAEPLGPALQAFLESGGVILALDADAPERADWLTVLGDSFALRPSRCTAGESSNLPAFLPDPRPTLLTEPHLLSGLPVPGTHFSRYQAAWRVLARCPEDYPILLEWNGPASVPNRPHPSSLIPHPSSPTERNGPASVPYGAGWVLVSTLHSEDLSLRKLLENVWARASGQRTGVAVSRIDWPEVQFGANRAQVEVRNLGRRRRHLTISLGEEGEPPAQTVEVDLALRTERTVSLNLDLQRRGPGRLVTTVRDRDTGETLFTSASPRYVIPPLLTAERVSPRYRPAVYATDPDQTVTVAVRLTPERPDLLLYVALCPAGIPEGTDPRAWLEEALKYHLFIGRTEPAEVAFDLSPMAPGAYEVRVWLTEAGGGVVAEERRPIWKVPKWEQETFVDHHQRLLVAGQPFFPLGLYKTPKERLAEIRQAGFNTVTPPDFGFGPHVREYLDAAQEAGLKVTPLIWCNAGWVKEQELHRHPAVLAWYMTDEPGGRNQEDPQQTLEAYQSFCEFDPYHPTLLVDNTLTDHARGADIIAPDIYPISFCAETGTNWPLAEIARKIRQVQQTDFTQHRAVWFVPQAIGGWGSVQIPTLRQERAMVYGAVCLGAKGILWYAYDTPELPGWNVTQEPELWPALKQIAAELGRLSPVLLSVEEPTDVSMEPDAPEILWRVCRHKGADYLLAVNWQSGFATPTFTFADGRTATAREVFTDQSVLVQEGQLRLTLAPLEVAVMRCP